MEKNNRYKLDKYNINKRKITITMYINDISIRSIEKISNVSDYINIKLDKNIGKNIDNNNN